MVKQWYKIPLENPEKIEEIKILKKNALTLVTANLLGILTYFCSKNLFLDSESVITTFNYVFGAAAIYVIIHYIVRTHLKNILAARRMYLLYYMLQRQIFVMLICLWIAQKIRNIQYEITYHFLDRIVLLMIGTLILIFVAGIVEIILGINLENTLTNVVGLAVCVVLLIFCYNYISFKLSLFDNITDVQVIDYQYAENFDNFYFQYENYISVSLSFVDENLDTYYGYTCFSDKTQTSIFDVQYFDPSKMYVWNANLTSTEVYQNSQVFNDLTSSTDTDSSAENDEYPYNFKFPSYQCFQLEKFSQFIQKTSSYEYQLLSIKQSKFTDLDSDIYFLRQNKFFRYTDNNIASFLGTMLFVIRPFFLFMILKIPELFNKYPWLLSYFITKSKLKVILRIDDYIAKIHFYSTEIAENISQSNLEEYFEKLGIYKNCYEFEATKKSKQLYIVMRTPQFNLIYSLYAMYTLKKFRKEINIEMFEFLQDLYINNSSLSIQKLQLNMDIKFEKMQPKQLYKYIKKIKQNEQKQKKEDQNLHYGQNNQQRVSNYTILDKDHIVEIELNLLSHDHLQQDNQDGNGNENNNNEQNVQQEFIEFQQQQMMDIELQHQ